MMRTIIVDDEPLGRDSVRELAEREPDLTIVAECANGDEAVDAIGALTPDLVFLDVQMPGCDGFAALKRLPLHRVPMVIFVTAYDAFAVQAFGVHATDYLLKPIDPSRFRASVDRARHEGNRTDARATSVERLLATLVSRRNIPSRLMIRSSDKISLLDVDQIDWIEAHGDYVIIHAGRRKELLRETISRMAERLDDRLFVRIHRSTIVRIDRVKELQPLFSGDYAVHLDNGATLTLSRSYRSRLFATLAEGR
jgi:two-component system, LytTR family, response regulator